MSVGAGVVVERLDGALREQRAEREREVGRAEHLVEAGEERHRQAHAAVLRRRGEADPAALGEGAVGFGEAGGGADDAVLEPRGGEVAGAAEGGEHVLGEAGGLGQHRLGGLGRRLGEALGLGEAAGADHGVEQEAHLGYRRAVRHPRLLVGPAVPGW